LFYAYNTHNLYKAILLRVNAKVDNKTIIFYFFRIKLHTALYVIVYTLIVKKDL